MELSYIPVIQECYVVISSSNNGQKQIDNTNHSDQYSDLFCNLSNFVQILFNIRRVLKQTTTSLLVDTETLISNIGGGLGLALGISAYSVVAPTLEWVFRRREARQESKRNVEQS